MYAIVEFPDERSVSVVPETWLVGETRCKWPVPGIAVTRAVHNCLAPSSRWKTHTCVLKKRGISSFTLARRYEELFTMQSEIETEDEKNRRRMSPVRFIEEPQTSQSVKEQDEQNTNVNESDSESQVDEDDDAEDDDDLQNEVAMKIAIENARLTKKRERTTEPTVSADSTHKEMLTELRHHRTVLEKILLESKKQTHYLKRLANDTERPAVVRQSGEESTKYLQCDDGTSLTLDDIVTSDPNKFALEFVRRVKGSAYLQSHICEPSTEKSQKVSMEADFVAQLKGALAIRFERFSWTRVREAVNRGSRDAKRKQK